MKKFFGILFGIVLTPIYFFIVKLILWFLCYAGVKSGVGWFVFVFFNIILLVNFGSVYFYLILIEWIGKYKITVVFSAVVISLWNILNAISLVICNFQKRPTYTCLQAIVEVVIAIEIIWIAKNVCEELKK